MNVTIFCNNKPLKNPGAFTVGKYFSHESVPPVGAGFVLSQQQVSRERETTPHDPRPRHAARQSSSQHVNNHSPNCRTQLVKAQRIWLCHSESFVEERDTDGTQEEHAHIWKPFTISASRVQRYIQWWCVRKFTQKWKNTMSERQLCDYRERPCICSAEQTLYYLSALKQLPKTEGLRAPLTYSHSLCASSHSLMSEVVPNEARRHQPLG